MPKHLTFRHRSSGVTLIELAVTLVVLGLLLAVAMPSAGAWIRNTQIRNTASSMLAGLNLARNEAIRRNVPIRFSLVTLADATAMSDSCAISPVGTSWVVSVRDPEGHCSYDPTVHPETDAADTDNPLIVQANAGGVGGTNVTVSARLGDGTAAGGIVTFNGFGRVTDAAPINVIDVRNQTDTADYRRLRLELTAGGAVRMCDMGADAPDSRSCLTRVSIP
jgi:type IV fimbrial biogenesis protein FimT